MFGTLGTWTLILGGDGSGSRKNRETVETGCGSGNAVEDEVESGGSILTLLVVVWRRRANIATSLGCSWGGGTGPGRSSI